MFLGMARGSVGDVTFARVKGQQVGRARNRRPNNPRTQSQMTQRSSFMSAVKFFAKGRQNYFTFAFEGKKANESDYNAFMRLNSKKGYQMTKEIYDNPNYPAVGEWQLSQGSLKDIPTAWQSATVNFAAMLGVTTSTLPTALTLGEVSQKLIATGEYMSGDILTFGQIITDSVVEEGSDPIPIAWSEDGIAWQLSQFILNPSSTELILNLIPNLGINVDGESGEVTVITNSLENASVIGGFFATHSRKTLNGLKVSNTYMRNNDAALRAIELSRTAAYNAYVIGEWQARELAILEGALSTSDNESEATKFNPSVAFPYTIPVSEEQVVGKFTGMDNFVPANLKVFVEVDGEIYLAEYDDIYDGVYTYEITVGSGMVYVNVAEEGGNVSVHSTDLWPTKVLTVQY